MKNKVCIIGLGYVGLPLACAIAKNKNYAVVGYDPAIDKIKKIKSRIAPIDDITAKKDLKEVKIHVSEKENILKGSKVYIICVPTPINNDYEPDYTYVINAARSISKYLKKGDSIVIESTVNPGACEEVIKPVLEESKLKAGRDFILAHCPERINPGDPKWNVYNIPRNVGATKRKDAEIVADFYRSFLLGEINVLNTLKEAEATKIIENTFRDINIAYVNELAMSFDRLGIDLINVIKGASNKPFAFMAHYPGCGVGGHCIAVDPYYLIKRASKADFDHQFLKNARKVNNSMPNYTVEKLIKSLNHIGKSVKDTKIAILGLSYKANVGDLRESPAFEIIKILKKDFEADLMVYDPYFPEQSTYKNLKQVLKKSQAVLIATSHEEFIETDYLKYNNIKVIVDGRNCLDKEKYYKKIVYTGIGR